MKTTQKTNKLIQNFNEKFPVGSSVRWRSRASAEEYQTLTVQHPAYDSYGQAVAFFIEKSGFCSIDPMFIDYA